MAKDVTVRVTGTNADGSINIQMPEGGNPFLTPIQQGGMVPYNPNAAMSSPSTGYRARINGQDINFASEADFLKAERLWQEASAAQSSIPSFGSGGSNGRGTGAWLRTGADAAAAVGAFLNGRAIRNKLTDLQDSLDDRKLAMAELDQLANNTKFVELIPVLKKLFLAERDSTETSVSLLEDQLTAVDIQTGAGVAKVVGDMYEGGTARKYEAGSESLMAVGAGGLGLGLLLSNNRDNRDNRRRR